MNRAILLLSFTWVLSFSSWAQDEATGQTVMGRLEAPPLIDGVIDSNEWDGATVIDQPFVQFQPDHGRPSDFRTVVRIAQTETALYVAFEAFDPDMDRLAAARTQRDDGLGHDDTVILMLDTFRDRRTGYGFQVNALSTQADFRVANNGRTIDSRWDAAWRSEAARLEDRWVVEMEIPFDILKYSGAKEDSWGINFQRTVPRRFERSFWTVPREALYRVSDWGLVEGVAGPRPVDAWTFIPYVLASYEKDRGENFEAGGDIRWRPTNNIGVDLTLNPDFALIEADVETINLTRFELRIDEKRPFFLEGNEMYEQRIEQFYSRRIGDVSWGAKTNGKLRATDFSAIATSADIHDRDTGMSERADYGVLRLQHGIGNGSNIGFLAANRHYQGEHSGSAGFDTTWFFTDTIGMTAQLLQVHGPNTDNGLAWFVRPAWDTDTSHFHIRYTNLDAGILDDFNTVGFLRDDDRKEWDTNLRHKFWFDGGVFDFIEPWVNYNRYTSQEGELRSWRLDTGVEFVFRNGFEFELYHLEEFKLFEKEFRNDRTRVEVEWDGRDGRNIEVYYSEGFNFDNDLKLYGVGITWPFGDRLRLRYDLTRLELEPDLEEESTTIHVFEAIYAFSPDMYAKVFVQTNSAISKENVQLLWEWRILPPFGTLQLAYQRGTSEQGQESDQGDTFFSKLAWVF